LKTPPLYPQLCSLQERTIDPILIAPTKPGLSLETSTTVNVVLLNAEKDQHKRQHPIITVWNKEERSNSNKE
jgi:hypothetical protein